MSEQEARELHQRGIRLMFWLSEFLIIIFATIILSGAIGVALGSIWSFKADRAKIEACQERYKGMRCELVAEGVQ